MPDPPRIDSDRPSFDARTLGLAAVPLLAGIGGTLAVDASLDAPDGTIDAVVLVLGTLASVLAACAVALALRGRAERAGAEQRGRELDLAVRERTADLESALAELETFNYSASHDLRSPLGAILNYAAVLREDHGDVLGDDGSRYLGRIEHNAREVVTMMDGLLTFSRVGRKELRPTEVALDDVVREAFAEASNGRGDDAPAVEWSELPRAVVDPDLLRTAFAGVFEHALEAVRGAPAPRIRVAGGPLDDGVELTVTDNGGALDVADGARLFELFERGSGARGRSPSIVLAVAARVVQRHGGRAWISADGDESTIHVALPARVG